MFNFFFVAELLKSETATPIRTSALLSCCRESDECLKMPYLSRLQKKAVLAKNAARKPHILACRVRELEVLLVMQQKQLDEMEKRLNYQDRMLDLQQDLIDVQNNRIDLQTKRLDEKAEEIEYHQRQILELGRRLNEPEEDLFGSADEPAVPPQSPPPPFELMCMLHYGVEGVAPVTISLQVHGSDTVEMVVSKILDSHGIQGQYITVSWDTEPIVNWEETLDSIGIDRSEVLFFTMVH
jgi:hypothetical protein